MGLQPLAQEEAATEMEIMLAQPGGAKVIDKALQGGEVRGPGAYGVERRSA